MNILKKSQSIRNHKTTASENLERFIKQINKDNPKIQCFCRAKHGQCSGKAKNIDDKINNGDKVGKLAGIVVGIKSNINVGDFHITRCLPHPGKTMFAVMMPQ
jgi:aspartyl-tRNA(Asn)/glutamyl-tRNA(Gln) amidotransferase subunit A